jgi:hypothetical protein
VSLPLQLVGWILAAVGVIRLIATVAISRRSVGTQREVYPPDDRL